MAARSILIFIRWAALLVCAGTGAFAVIAVITAFLTDTVMVNPQGEFATLPLVPRLLVATGSLLALATVAVVAAAVSHLAARAAQEPLRRDVPRTAVVIGVALIVGSLATQVVNHIAEQLTLQIWSDDTWLFSWFFNVDLTLPAVGIAFLVIAAILRSGARLQRDLEGLV